MKVSTDYPSPGFCTHLDKEEVVISAILYSPPTKSMVIYFCQKWQIAFHQNCALKYSQLSLIAEWFVLIMQCQGH